MHQMIRTGLFVSALSMALWAGMAQARQDSPGEVRQIRVACDMAANGRLSDCSVLSRQGTDAGFDAAALEATRSIRVWPLTDEITPGRVHFPILLEAPTDRQPGGGLRVRPVADDRRATVPAVPEGFDGQASAGLYCFVSRTGTLTDCVDDTRSSLPGLLQDGLIYFRPVETLSGRKIDLPDRWPASPDEMRGSWVDLPEQPAWTAIGLGGAEYYLRQESNGLVWVVQLEGRFSTYNLFEYDCHGRRSRQLLGIYARETGLRRLKETSRNWVMHGRRGRAARSPDTLDADHRDPFGIVCPA